MTIANAGGYLRLQLPRALYDGKQKYISLGFKDTAENRALAEVKRLQVEQDVKAQLLGFDLFDWSWEKYTGIKRPNLTVIESLGTHEPPAKPKLKLGELWEMWVEHRRPTLEETTFRSEWKTFTNLLKPVSHLELNAQTAQEIYQHVIKATKSQATITKLLSQLHHAYDRALNLGLTEGKNHFYGLVEEARKMVKPHKDVSASDEDADIRAFTYDEMIAILDYLSTTRSNWHDFTKFRFLTGCRIGEAIALKWRHVAPDCSFIVFGESHSSRYKITKKTKNGTVRRFPCNVDLQEFLRSVKPDDAQPDDVVFKSPTGKQIDSHMYSQAWYGRKHMQQKDEDGNPKWYPGFIEKLVEQGKLRQYLKPYATRHTFITLMIDAGVDMLVISSLCENSPEVILKHYYQKNTGVNLPSLKIKPLTEI